MVGIIILSWNRREDTLECLRSLSHIEYPSYRIFLVDNGSTDGTAEAVKELFPAVDIIQNGKNLGYAAGNNVGIREVLNLGIETVLLLNDDTVVDPHFLTILVESLYRSPDIGAVNPTIYYFDDPDIIWSAGGQINERTGIAHQRHFKEIDRGQLGSSERDVHYAIGAAILIKAEALEKVGMLDSEFFVYYEETDWCFRARAAGFRIVYVPTARIWHKVSRNMTQGHETLSYYFCRNRLLFLHKRGKSKARLLKITILEYCRMAISFAVTGRKKQSRFVLRGILDFYLERFGRANL